MARLEVPMKDNQRFNSTTPPHELLDFRTPPDKFFEVRHLGIPDMSVAPWRLVVDGLVDQDMELGLADLQALPQARDEDLYWSYQFLSGALTLTLSESGRLDVVSGGLCRSGDIDAASKRLAAYAAAGLIEVCRRGAG